MPNAVTLIRVDTIIFALEHIVKTEFKDNPIAPRLSISLDVTEGEATGYEDGSSTGYTHPETILLTGTDATNVWKFLSDRAVNLTAPTQTS